MPKINIFLLDNMNNIKEELNIIKSISYKEFLVQITQKFKIIQDKYEIFILDKANKEIKINNETDYNKIEDIIFIREIFKNTFQPSLFDININLIDETKKEALNLKFSCTLCKNLINNEEPYFCYKCQKIFHERCLQEWDKRCKEQDTILSCPNCRNELPIEE